MSPFTGNRLFVQQLVQAYIESIPWLCDILLKGPVMWKLCICHDVIMITNTFNEMELVRYLRSSPKYQVTYTTDLRYISQQVCDLLRFLWFGTGRINSHMKYWLTVSGLIPCVCICQGINPKDVSNLIIGNVTHAGWWDNQSKMNLNKIMWQIFIKKNFLN